MKKILILHTGGTIAMHEDKATGAIRPDNKNPLLHFDLPIDTDIEFITEEILNLPSPHITPAEMLLLKKRIVKAHNTGIAGVVITHGTDTLEETAYFLDVTVKEKIAIVLTGAMRSSNEVGSDGLYNFYSALRVAACQEASGMGALVVMNDEIHSARYVTKTHTTNVATFRSPTFGPIGLLSKHQIHFFQQPIQNNHLDITQVVGKIPIVKAYAGMDETLLNLLVEAKIDGLIIEALGAGNLPPASLPAIQNLLKTQIPLVLVSRCFNGIAEGVYDYEGGGKRLQELGILFCPGLNSQKARIRLLSALNSNLNKEQLAHFMTHPVQLA